VITLFPCALWLGYSRPAFFFWGRVAQCRRIPSHRSRPVVFCLDLFANFKESLRQLLVLTFEVRQLCLHYGQCRAGDRKQALIEPYVPLQETTARDVQVALKLGNLEPKFLLSRRLEGHWLISVFDHSSPPFLLRVVADFAEVSGRGGQKGDKRRASRNRLLNLEGLDVLGKGLQNLYASVRFRPAPPIFLGIWL